MDKIAEKIEKLIRADCTTAGGCDKCTKLTKAILALIEQEQKPILEELAKVKKQNYYLSSKRKCGLVNPKECKYVPGSCFKCKYSRENDKYKPMVEALKVARPYVEASAKAMKHTIVTKPAEDLAKINAVLPKGEGK